MVEALQSHDDKKRLLHELFVLPLQQLIAVCWSRVASIALCFLVRYTQCWVGGLAGAGG